jgi:hypothetical protein
MQNWFVEVYQKCEKRLKWRTAAVQAWPVVRNQDNHCFVSYLCFTTFHRFSAMMMTDFKKF